MAENDLLQKTIWQQIGCFLSTQTQIEQDYRMAMPMNVSGRHFTIDRTGLSQKQHSIYWKYMSECHHQKISKKVARQIFGIKDHYRWNKHLQQVDDKQRHLAIDINSDVCSNGEGGLRTIQGKKNNCIRRSH